MIYRGSVNKDQFAVLFGLVVTYNAFWVKPPVDTDGRVEYEIVVHDRASEFSDQLAKLHPALPRKTLWQKLVYVFS